MKFTINREDKIQTARKIKIILCETDYIIEEVLGEIIITKVDFEDSTIMIKPKVSNLISIK